ncbi:MAG: flippase-like domain-containing protein, partial [SAR202 cluster bacterium]|nr:flippase-like domain-containing protein [SAR202 cluster bacterium]
MRIPSILSLGPAGPSPRPNAALLLQGKRPRVVAGLALTALALTVALWATDATKVGSAFHAMASRPVLLGAFLAAYRLAFGLRAMAWRRLEPRLSALGAFSILQTALFANHVLPLKGGDVIRPLLAARRGVPLTEAVASSVAARVIDFAALIAIAGTLIAWSPRGMSLSPAALLLPPASVGAAALLLIWLRADGAIPPMPRRLELAVARVRAATRRMSNRRLASAMAWTLPSWLLEGAVLYVAARAMGAEVSPAAAVAATAFTILFQAFHFTPGGIGVYEASMTAALAAHGVPLEHGLALAVFTHGLKFGYSYTAGLAFTLLEQRHALGMGAVGKRHWASVRPAAAARWVPAVAALATAALSHGWNQRGWEAWAGLGVAAAAVAPLALVLSRVRFNGPLLVVAGGLALAALPLFGAPGAVDTALFMGVFALSALALGRGLSAVGLAGSLLAGLALYVSVAGGGIGAGVEVAAYAAAAGIAMLLLRQWVPAWVPLPAAPARRSGPLVVIVPALNEAANLPRTLAAVP